MKIKYKEMSTIEKVITVVRIFTSLAVIIFATLQILNIWDEAINLAAPLVGIVLLLQSVQEWKRSRSVAIFGLCAAIFVFICAFVVWFNKPNLIPKDEVTEWNCSVICCGESIDNSYVTTYSNEEVVSNTGFLTLQNQNDFTIIVHILSEDKEERTSEIEAGGVSVLHQVKKNKVYTIGIHADVKEGEEIKLMVYDGKKSEPYDNNVLGIKQLEETYPQFFNISTDGGLTVYVWQMAENDYRCHLVNRSIDALTDRTFAFEFGTTIAEMRKILSTYDIKREDIVIRSVVNPLSSYYYEIDNTYRTNVEELFWKE